MSKDDRDEELRGLAAYEEASERAFLETEEAGADEPDDCPRCQLVALLNEYQHRVEAAGAALMDVVEAAKGPTFRRERAQVLPQLQRMNRDLKAAWDGALPVGEVYGFVCEDSGPAVVDRTLN